MHLRDVPDHVHDELQRRAAASAMSLRQYTVKVLDEHCSALTIDDWIARVAQRRARWLADGRLPHVDAADTLRAARQEDDQAASG